MATPDEVAAALGRAAQLAPQLCSKVIRKGAADIEADAMSLAPYDTGNLKSSITVSLDGPLTARIGPTANYGKYVELGTAPHIIVPRKAKALFFNGIFSARVSHPGTRPQPYMAPAVDRQVPSIVQALGQLATEIF